MPRKKPDLKDMEVARRVRALRLEKGLSQGKLGSALGLTFQQIQKYEKGTNRIGAGRLQKIAEVFDVPVAALFGAAAPAAPEDLIELADTATALRLLRAFSRISSPKLKLALATLAEEIAQQANGESRTDE